MKNLESKLQQNCVKWFRYQYPELLLFSIPNGSKRNIITAQILKAEGVLSGVSDLFLAYTNKQYHGLFIEMKYGNNKLSENQIKFIEKAEKYGYKCVVCYTFDEFKNEVESYINKYH